tara:strand:+ start:489 stop:2330 length:1842 start_codon:yes stop_codon:yes gene_type:complete
MIIASIYPCPFDNQVRHDFSASIYKNGKIFAYEEDKTTSFKNFSNYQFSEKSLFYGFKELKTSPKDVDTWLLPEPSKNFKTKNLFIFFSGILKCYDGKKNDFNKWLKKKVFFIKHHDSHIGLAVASSGYKKTLYLSLDGGGDFGDTRNSVFGEFSNFKFRNFGEDKGLGNICSFHAFVTDFLCFGIDNGKVNGLSAYGKVRDELYNKFNKVVTVNKNGIKFDRKRFKATELDFNKFSFEGYQRYKVLNNQPSKTNIFEICKGYLLEDVAKTAEQFLRDKVLIFLKSLKKRKSSRNIVFSGGLFLNVALNGFISEKKIFENNFFNMAPADNGLSLGAIGFYLLKFKKKNFKLNKYGLTPFLGPSFSQEEVIRIISKFNLKYEIPRNLHYDIAKNISKRKIVGVFNGRAEFGQRSLGNRSILADPRSKASKTRLNLLLKKRDWFMPFAPAVIDKDFEKYFPNQHQSYYMQVTNQIKNNKLSKKIPSAVHVDGSCRTQLVEKKINNNFWNIINNFKKITKLPIVLNTSFNRHGISTISNPRQAIEHLLEGCIDVLYINGLKIKSKLGAKKLKEDMNFINTEKNLLKKENLSWYHKNKQYLDKKSIKMFQSFLKKKF